jgi:hypothetical protein
MTNIDYSGLLPSVAQKTAPLVRDILGGHGRNLHSIHIVGSAVIPDYDEKISDINSVVVLHDMDLGFVEFLAPLGKKYGKKGIAAPLVMTPEYIRDSLDAFPIEFHDFKLIHKTVYGPDILKELNIAGHHLRLQCERELKSKLIALRQGYISSLGKTKELIPVLVSSFTGSMALFRAIITLLGKEPPVSRPEVISLLGSSCSVDTAVFDDLLQLKARRARPSDIEMLYYFEKYYTSLEAVGKLINELPS